jgi:hypothetical protein
VSLRMLHEGGLYGDSYEWSDLGKSLARATKTKIGSAPSPIERGIL